MRDENHEKQPFEVCGNCSRANMKLKKYLEEILSIKAFIQSRMAK